MYREGKVGSWGGLDLEGSYWTILNPHHRVWIVMTKLRDHAKDLQGEAW